MKFIRRIGQILWKVIKKINIEKAIEDIKNIVGTYFTKTRFASLQKDTDRLTAIFLQFLSEEKNLNFNVTAVLYHYVKL